MKDFLKDLEEVYKRKREEKKQRFTEDPSPFRLVLTAIFGITAVGMAGWVVYRAFFEQDLMSTCLVALTILQIIFLKTGGDEND